MKKYIFFIVILSLFGSVAAQQQQKQNPSYNENSKVLFGVFVGPSIDWFAPTSKAITRNNAKGGFIAGVNIDCSLHKNKTFYFSTGVLIRYLQGDLALENQYLFNIFADTLVLPAVRNYQTTYLTIPTGVKFRIKPINNCVFLVKLGLYHNFKIGGNQVDKFSLPSEDETVSPKYFITTEKIKNQDASLFAESGYLGLGFEYSFGKIGVFAHADYSCQFNYFSAKAKNNVTDAQFKSIVHSLHIFLGVLF